MPGFAHIDDDKAEENRAKEGATSFGGTCAPQRLHATVAAQPRRPSKGVGLSRAWARAASRRYYRGPSKKGSTASFKLYALSGRLEIAKGSSKDEVVKAMKGKVLSKATLSATV